VWREGLLGSSLNYDFNSDELVWVRAEAAVAGRRRVLAALVRVEETTAFSSKHALLTGRMNVEVTNSLGLLLSVTDLLGLTHSMLLTDPLVAPDPTANTTPPTSGVTAVRCWTHASCLTGTVGGLSSTVAPVSTVVAAGKLLQTPSPTATSASAIGQIKQQAINSGTYVASNAGHKSPSSAPACVIPAAANANTIVYIDKVGTTGTSHTNEGPGDQFCVLSVSANKTYKALVIGSGRVILRGNNTNSSGSVNTFRGVLYALNSQRAWLGDNSLPAREVIRLERGARVVGGVAADGTSAQVGIYPPTVSCGFIGLGCILASLLGTTLDSVNDYSPAITSNVAVMLAVKTYGTSRVESGTYRDIVGELR
jgi:hypothetical protein